MLARRSIPTILALGLAGCGAHEDLCGAMPAACAAHGTVVSMDFAATKGDFYAAPFPTDARLLATGGVDVSDFPNPDNVDLVSRLLAMIQADARGFGLTSGVFF